MAGKVYDPTKLYSDHAAAFTKLNKQLVEDLFSAQGPYSQAEFVPNWLESHELGYELVRLEEMGEVEHRFGIFIDVQPRSLENVEPVTSKGGKAVAYWNYKAHIMADDYTLRLYSDVPYHYVVAYPDGYIGVNPIKSGPDRAAQSVLLMQNKGGSIPFMPFVALAFFMEIEKEGSVLFKWLCENGEGWRDAYGA